MSDKEREIKREHWREGRAAMQAGDKLQSNPHNQGSLAWVFWAGGWRSVRGRGAMIWQKCEGALAG